jgi:sugar lactone lactonase YvrE
MTGMDVFDGRVCALGEGPWYDEQTDRAYWVDILGSRVLWRELGTGATGELPTPGHVGAAVPRASGGLVLCLPDGPVLWDPDGTLRPLGGYMAADARALAGAATPQALTGPATPLGAPRRRSNDAKADPAGRLWLGTMAYDNTTGTGALYRLLPDAEMPERVLGGVTISNGLGWSPDGTTMYFVDTPTGRVDAFEFDMDAGHLGSRRAYVTVPAEAGAPDGLCVDADGGVWVALWGGGAVRRYAPDGRLDREVHLPTPLTTSCAFAGPGHTLLIITSAAVGRPNDAHAGLTYVHLPDDVSGLPVDRFGH